MRYLLSLNFDTETSDAPLAVAITGAAGGPAVTLDGKEKGGAFVVERGDTLCPEIVASAPQKSEAQVKVSSLVLAVKNEKPRKRLSPFDKYDACVCIKEWGLPNRVDIRDIHTVTMVRALEPLTVTAKSGAWTLEGYLSVLIGQAAEEGGFKTRPRSYAFSLKLKIGA